MLLLLFLFISLLSSTSADDSYYFTADDNHINYTCIGLKAPGWTPIANVCVNTAVSPTTWAAANDACAASASVALSMLSWLHSRLLPLLPLPLDGAFWTAYRTENTTALATLQGRLTSIYNPLWLPLEPPRGRNASTWCVAYALDRAGSKEGGWRLEDCAVRLRPLCQTFACRDDEFRCADNTRCIPRSAVHDRIEDCADGSDEKEEMESRFKSPSANGSLAYICALPQDLRHLRVLSVGYGSGDAIEYTCNDGWTSPFFPTADLAESQVLRSLCGGATHEWSPPVSCAIVCTCPPNPEYHNLTLLPIEGNTHGHHAEFVIPGHEDDRDWRVVAFCDARRCAPDGTGGRWLFFNGQLLEWASRCWLPMIPFLEWESGNPVHVGDTVEYKCMPNTRLLEPVSPVCQADGSISEWPTCVLDLDEGVCGEHGKLHLRAPFYSCFCDVGFSFNGTSCVDIDECLENLAICDRDSTCVNLDGNYRCDCGEGRCPAAEKPRPELGVNANTLCPCHVVENDKKYASLCYSCRCSLESLYASLPSMVVVTGPVFVPNEPFRLGPVAVFWKPNDVMHQFTARCVHGEWQLPDRILCKLSPDLKGWTLERAEYAPFERMMLSCSAAFEEEISVVAMCGRDGRVAAKLPECKSGIHLNVCQLVGCIISSTDSCIQNDQPTCVCKEGFFGEFCEFDNSQNCQLPNQPTESSISPHGFNDAHSCPGSGEECVPLSLPGNEQAIAAGCGCFNSSGPLLPAPCQPVFFSCDDWCLGECVAIADAFQCSCGSDFSGEFCDISPDECQRSYHEAQLMESYDGRYCVHGEKCVPGNSSYICECLHGASGKQCENMDDMCEAFKWCGSNGACINIGMGSIQCICNPGFTGNNCEVRLNDCEAFADYCQNGGVCNSIVEKCDCFLPWGGRYCTAYYGLVFDGCNCTNGLCFYTQDDDEVAPRMRCYCSEKEFEDNPCYTGEKCDQEILHCPHSPCFPAGGSCVNDKAKSYACECNPGYTGVMCEQTMDVCTGYCENGGECRVLEGSVPECKCSREWTGSRCEIRKKQTGMRSGNLRISSETEMQQSSLIAASKSISICGWIHWQPAAATSAPAEFMRISSKPQIRFTTSAVLIGDDGMEMKLAPFMWQQFCVSCEGSQWHVDVNGVRGKLAMSAAVDASSLSGGRVQLVPAPETRTGRFVGELNHIELYDFMLSESQVAQMAFNCSAFSKAVTPSIPWSSLVYLFSPDDVTLPPLCENARCFPGNVVCGGQKDKIAPVAVECPKDMLIIATRSANLTMVQWPEPVFIDNIQVTSVTSNFRNNRPFPLGEFDIVYVASDAAGNTATCAFRVFVAPNQCTLPSLPPGNATLTSLSIAGVGTDMEASFKCDDPYFPIAVPDFYTCDYLGQWSRRLLMRALSLPTCVNTIKATEHLECLIDLAIHGDDVVDLCGGVAEMSMALDFETMKHSDTFNFCTTLSACFKEAFRKKVKLVDVICERLQPSFNNSLQLLILIRVAENDYFTSQQLCPFGEENAYYTCDDEEYPVHVGPGGSRCAQCPRGTFVDGDNCSPCPADSYSDQINMHNCIHCKTNYTTGGHIGCNKTNDCYLSCGPGTYANLTVDASSCANCPIGQYNDEFGRTECKRCPQGLATTHTGCKGVKECIKICGAGMEMDKNYKCNPCPRATYRGENDPECKACPTGLSTVHESSTLFTDCNLLFCGKDSFVNTSLPCQGLDPGEFVRDKSTYAKHCVRCPPGTHQPLSNQTSCTECHPGQEVHDPSCLTGDLCLPGVPSCPAGSYCAKPKGQTVYSCVEGTGPSKEPSGFPWWVIVFIALGTIFLVTAVGVAIFLNRKRLQRRKRSPSDLAVHSTPPIATLSSAATGNQLRVYPDENWSNDGDKTPESTISTRGGRYGEEAANSRPRAGISPFDFIPDGHMILLPRALLTEAEMLTGRRQNNSLITFDSGRQEQAQRGFQPENSQNPLEVLRRRHQKSFPVLQTPGFKPYLPMDSPQDDEDDMISFD